ncbi:MAG: hypothetical protein ACKV19_24480 [Verrucomicrobiales bacterium]
MKSLITILLIGAFASTVADGQIPADARQEKVSSVPLEPKPGIYECGSYTFLLQELPRADGSAIQAGSLYLDGKPVAGGDYHRLELPIGSFIWYPLTENAKQIAWTRIDPKKKHSRWDMAVISDRKDSRGNWVTKQKPSPEEEDRNRRGEDGQPEKPNR